MLNYSPPPSPPPAAAPRQGRCTNRECLRMTSPTPLRSTREWPMLILAIALVCAICTPLWQWNVAQTPDEAAPTKWTAERFARLLLGPEQIACYVAFTWALFVLGGRFWEVRRQHRAFRLDLLPPGQV